MAAGWECETLPILRHLISDVDSSAYTYTDSRLTEVLLVAAQLMQKEATFSQTYVINIAALDITPDPTTPTRDDGFINLMVVKAAVIIALGEWKTESSKSIRITDGKSTIDATNVAKSKKGVYDDLLKLYEESLVQFRAGDSSPGRAILGPFSSERVNYQYDSFRTFN